MLVCLTALVRTCLRLSMCCTGGCPLLTNVLVIVVGGIPIAMPTVLRWASACCDCALVLNATQTCHFLLHCIQQPLRAAQARQPA